MGDNKIRVGGGQSECYVVHSGDKKPFFLKQLKDQGESERRSRFFVEATIYMSVEINGIQQIVETNSELFKNMEILLYYVSDYIDGVRFDEYVKQEPLKEETIIDLFKQLLKNT